MPDTTLVLGDFRFARFEVPEQIVFGGDQKLIVHELIGGTRVIDAMGDQPMALEWSGFLVGSSAMDRALYLDGLRKAGKALSLSWHRLSYSVVVRSLRCTFQRFYRLPYTITCEVLEDKTAPVAALPPPSPEQMVNSDLAAVTALSTGIGDASLIGLVAALGSAIAAAGNLSKAPRAVLGTLHTPLQAVRARTAALLSGMGQTPGLGVMGGTAGVDPLTLAATLTNQAAVVSGIPDVLALHRTLGRIEANLRALGAGGKSVTVGNGNLFAVAAKEYGNAKAWSAIAEANGLVDPDVSGIATLTIPSSPPLADGVLRG